MPILNFSQKFRRREIVLLSSIVLCLLTIIVLNFSFLLSLFSSFFITIQKPFNTISRQVENIVRSFRYAEQIIDENNQLKILNTNLLQENIKLKNLSEENKQLLEILNYTKNNNQTNFRLAYIYAQDTLNISNIIFLDQGVNHGIKVGNHVVYNGLYLGKIIEVWPNSSKAELIFSPNLKIVASIPDINSSGIIHGQIGFGLIMEDIPPDAKLQIGQVVVTSPIDPQMPADLLLGEIQEIIKNDQDIFQKAVVKPYFDQKNLQYVSIQVQS